MTKTATEIRLRAEQADKQAWVAHRALRTMLDSVMRVRFPILIAAKARAGDFGPEAARLQRLDDSLATHPALRHLTVLPRPLEIFHGHP